jgi:peptide/nickel transport system substrate-binding protein
LTTFESIGERSGLVRLRQAASLVVVLSSLHACAPTPERRATTVLFASGADLQSINPLVAVHPLAKQVQKHVLFMTLAAYNSDLRAVPRLGSWTWHADRTQLDFHLRQDVYWHDGVKTSAQDVAWTLEQARSPAVLYPRAADLDAIAAVGVVDSFTVSVRFVRPQPIFPDVLTDLAILPAHRFAESGAAIRTHPFNLHPVGNGPFEFVEYRPNQRWVFRRRADYPVDLGRAHLDRLVIVIVDEPTTKLAALTSGELDFAGINPAHASFVQEDPTLEVVDYPVQLAVGLIWNLRRAPFDDVELRRAMTIALNRRLIVDAFVYGFGDVADGPVSPDHPWFEKIPPLAFSRDDANRRLDALGWARGSDGIRMRDGKRLTVELLTVGSGDNALEQMVQAQLRDVGVDVRLRMSELTAFLAVAQGSERDYDALVTGIPGDLSLGHVAAMFGGSGGPLNYSGYASAEFDRAVRRARGATTEAEMEEGWREAQRILARDLPVTWLYHARGVQGKNRRVHGVRLDLRGELATVAQWTIAHDDSTPQVAR